MAGPFDVMPAGEGVGAGLAGIGMILRANEEKREEEEALKAAEARKRSMMGAVWDAYQSKNADAWASVVDEYPEAADMAMQGMGVVEDWQRKEMAGAALRVLSSPQTAIPDLERRITLGTAQGRNMSDSQELLDMLKSGDIEGANSLAKMTLISADRDMWNSYKESLPAQPEPYTDIAKANQDLAAGLITPEQYAVTTKPDDSREMREDQNGVLRYLDGAQEAVFPEVERVAPTLANKDRFDQAKVIRGEIATATKDFTEIANAWDRIAASASDPSAAGDMALIFNYMKMLDPGSTVREGEYANARNAAGIPERIRRAFNSAKDGEQLTPTMRADFFNQAENIFEAAQGRASSITDEFVRLAESAGLTRDDVVIERGASPDVNTGAYPEGTIIRNPTTGEEQVMRNGEWVSSNG